MLFALGLACHSNTAAETPHVRVSASSKEPITVACAPEPAWVVMTSQVSADAARTGRITLEGTVKESPCAVRLQLRGDKANSLLNLTVPASRGHGLTGSASASTEAPVGTLELWVAAVGPADATATYTYKLEVVEGSATGR